MLQLPRLGMINVHASLLPKYRGAAPVHRAVINGDTETGVTIMRMVVALDAGAMMATVTRPIAADETSDVVERDLARLAVAPLLSVIDQLESGTAREEPQDDSQSSYAARLTKEEGLIDWTQSAADIHNRVRGLYPWPHAYTHAKGSRIIVLRSQVEETAMGSDPGSDPGTVVDVSRDGLTVAAGRGTRLKLLEIQPEGRRAMAVRDFLAGHPLPVGTRLGSDPGSDPK
jgi:methionyl-tRNA formyltransferase